ncbi:MAG: PQQ-dependent sugar dehydrogenase [Verrucomicrobiales bacterium]|nr:PQQ-dependent sugar dehydrogenase [Verrucomicrobiales bacterium]
MIRLLSILAFASGASLLPALAGSPWTVEPLPFEKGSDQQVGGIDVLPDGRVFACFHRGEIRLFDPETSTWSIFAKGLQEPLGIHAESESSVVIVQRPELTRVSDTDGDGKADRFQKISDDFGISGNYHEFAFGPLQDADGNWIVALNVASNGAGIRDEIRGDFLEIGLPRDDFYVDDWKAVKNKAGRMYSRVAWRGCIISIDNETGKITPLAYGFRSPNGIGFDGHGRLYASDNQGDWRGTSPLYHIEEGKFYGHPASLPWMPDYDGRPPLDIPVEELEELRTPAAIWFPHGTMANSPTEPILIPDGFGPFAGQMLIGEMNRPRIVRLMMEEVNGVIQGACVPFIDDSGLPSGVNRLAFGPENVLWTGHTHLSWAGDEGMSKITYDGSQAPQEVSSLTITPHGFEVTFLHPVAEMGEVTLSSFTYLYHKDYGSPKMDERPEAFDPEKVNETTFRVNLKEPLRADFCYEFDFSVADHAMVVYTVREIPGKP